MQPGTSPPPKVLAVPFQLMAAAGRKQKVQSELPIAAKVAETVSSVVLRRNSNTNSRNISRGNSDDGDLPRQAVIRQKEIDRQRQILLVLDIDRYQTDRW